MSEYVITTDNNSDLPEKYLKDHGVGCMYLSYSMDGKNYTHGNFLPEHEFYEAMRNGSMPTTAQVNPENAKALLEPYLKEGKDILHIAFSSALSGTYNSSRIAAEELMEDYPDRKIIVVDSLGASLGQGLLVYLAQEKKEQGEDMETVAKWAEENRLHMVHLFTVNDLNHLYRGGRISRTTAVVGSMLNIKPVLHVDNDGKLTAIGKVRGRKKSLQELVKLMDEKIGSYHDTCHLFSILRDCCIECTQGYNVFLDTAVQFFGNLSIIKHFVINHCQYNLFQCHKHSSCSVCYNVQFGIELSSGNMMNFIK